MLRGMIIMSQKRYDEVVIEKEKTKTNELRKEQEKMANKIKEKELHK